MDSPAISICIPTYNGTEFLEQCVESALNQDFSDIEIIICDDRSTDGTHDMAMALARRDPRIHVFANAKNLGLVGNWNATLSHAKGTWIKFLFQDDVLYPKALSTMMALADKTGMKFIASYRDFIYAENSAQDRALYTENAALIKNLFSGKETLDPEAVANFAIAHVGINFVGEPSVTLIHRDVFARVGLFDPTLAQRCDTEFWVRAGLAEGVAMVRTPLAGFRVHGGSTSASNYSARKFADTWADPVVLKHHYVFHEKYLPLRQLAIRRHQMPTLKRELWDTAHDASSVARASTSSPSSSSSSSSPNRALDDWNKLCKTYPRLKQVPMYWRADRIVRRAIAKLVRGGA